MYVVDNVSLVDITFMLTELFALTLGLTRIDQFIYSRHRYENSYNIRANSRLLFEKVKHLHKK